VAWTPRDRGQNCQESSVALTPRSRIPSSMPGAVVAISWGPCESGVEFLSFFRGRDLILLFFASMLLLYALLPFLFLSCRLSTCLCLCLCFVSFRLALGV
jgi:hypothetical protein